MTETQRLLAVGLIVNAALYLLCVFTAGMVTGNAWAWRLSLVAMGVTYLSYLAQISIPQYRVSCSCFVIASAVLGANAGLVLL